METGVSIRDIEDMFNVDVERFRVCFAKGVKDETLAEEFGLDQEQVELVQAGLGLYRKKRWRQKDISMVAGLLDEYSDYTIAYRLGVTEGAVRSVRTRINKGLYNPQGTDLITEISIPPRRRALLKKLSEMLVEHRNSKPPVKEQPATENPVPAVAVTAPAFDEAVMLVDTQTLYETLVRRLAEEIHREALAGANNDLGLYSTAVVKKTCARWGDFKVDLAEAAMRLWEEK